MNRRKTGRGTRGGVLSILPAALLLSACSGGAPEVVTGETDPAGWSAASPVILEYDNRDTLAPREIHLLVRRRNDYGWDRLNLLVLTTAPDGRSQSDTLSVAFGTAAVAAAPTDRPASTTEASSYLYTDYRIPYRRGARLDRAGIYRFRLVPLAPAPPVEGIVGVGLEVVCINTPSSIAQ